jgi:hypothetical protein
MVCTVCNSSLCYCTLRAMQEWEKLNAPAPTRLPRAPRWLIK